MISCLTPAACHALLLVLLAPLAEAGPYAYIDATPANTTLNGAALVAGTNYIIGFARDLAAGTNLNSGQPVHTVTVNSAAFDGDPARWSGIGYRASRGLVDNIRVMPTGFTARAGTLYPALTGGLSGDDDNDGLTNAIEFAFGLDPLPDDERNRPSHASSS